MTSVSYAETVTVHLRGIPVPLAVEAWARRTELLREFALITGDLTDTPSLPGHDVPLRVLDLVVTLTQQLHVLLDDVERRLDEAVARSATTIDDYAFELPADSASMTRVMADLLDEADEYCWGVAELVDVVTPPECAAYRRWMYAQILDQLEGRLPVAWPDSAAARALWPSIR